LFNRLFAQGLALASVASLVAIAGCDMANLPGSTKPSASPSSQPSVSPTNSPVQSASALQGRLTFALNPNSNPDVSLKVGLKQKLAGGTAFSKIPTTADTDTSGNFAFNGLPDADYQLVYDDEGKVAAASFNTTGVAVSDPVSVSASQSAIPQKSMELSWDFSNAAPQPNASITRSASTTFSFPVKPGLGGNADYVVTLYPTTDTSSGALQSGSAYDKGSGTVSINMDLTGLQSGQRYFVVKYFKADGVFGGANFYGQTKPIPITLQ
jgi:hypothetical protein